MTYAKLILPYNPSNQDVSATPKQKLSLKGKLKSALNNASNAVKNAVKNPGQTMTNLGKYINQNEDLILNKFSGIGIAQLMASGKITNKNAVDYLFLGFLPPLTDTATVLGYTGVQQMKAALTNGNINVGQFVNGFSRAAKTITDLRNKVKNIDNFTKKNVIELDVTYNHSENYQSEIGDRRVQDGITWAEYVHNLPEIFTLTCGLQDGKRYSITEFKEMLTFLRKKKVPFSIEIDEEITDNVLLQNFAPTRDGATNGLEYTLELKKVNIGTVEVAEINIQALPVQESATSSNGSSSSSSSSSANVTIPKLPNYSVNPFDSAKKAMTNKNRSWAKNLFNPK